MATRREFLQKSLLAGVGIAVLGKSALEAGNNQHSFEKIAGAGGGKFSLGKLPYSYSALEPWIDARTMEIHYSKHHQAYVDNLNKAIEKKNAAQPSLSVAPTATDAMAVVTEESDEKSELEKLIRNISREDVAIRNNGGGHWNHTFFWDIMRPSNESPDPNFPAGELRDALVKTFGTFEEFKNKFSQAAKDRFGSGWAWLVKTEKGLVITSTPNQDNPLMDVAEVQGKPILGIDVWEHAYYLKHQNVRGNYINEWWNVVNWDKVNELYLMK